MGQAAETPFEDETIEATEAAVDETARRAGSERRAVWALLVEVEDLEAALAAARGKISLGYERGTQPSRPER